MRTRTRSTCLLLIASITLLSGAVGGTAAAQTAVVEPGGLERILVPGRTVWLTDATGREAKTHIVRAADGMVSVGDPGEPPRTLRLEEVQRVRVEDNDSVLNGAIIGAASAVASGLFMCRLTEPWTTCRDDGGPMLRFGGLGAAAGMAIDALLRNRRTIYDASPAGARLDAAPLIARDGIGVRLALRF